MFEEGSLLAETAYGPSGGAGRPPLMRKAKRLEGRMSHEKQTARDDLAVALEMMAAAISPDVYRKAAADLGRMELAETAFKYTRRALDRHRAEPECDCGYEVLWETLGRLFAWEDDPRGIPIGMWSAAYNAFKAVGSKPHCDTNCPCYQEGLEAQRERVGGGRA